MIRTKPDIYKPVTYKMMNSVYLCPQQIWDKKSDWAHFFGETYFFREQTLNLKGKKTHSKWEFKKLNVTCG